ncbi:MAG: TnpV protein [Clostridia bacterium]|nr:TnpV protein [Clostridia bacterium]
MEDYITEKHIYDEKNGLWYEQQGNYSVFLEPIKQMAAREGVTEQLKVRDQMLWVRRMNNIRNRATEIVNTELIYT